MQVILAKTAGFCFGVKRAVDMVYEQAEHGDVYTYGPIIHNEEVVKDLEDKGVSIIHNEEELKQLREGTVVIRSHGVERRIYEEAGEHHLNLVDATCPFVKKIHNIVDKDSAKGNQIVIIGNKHHPEVQGICGWCNTQPIVIESEEEAENLSDFGGKELSLVAQTTFNHKKFNKMVEIFEKKGYNITVYNTICNATEERQKEDTFVACRKRPDFY